MALCYVNISLSQAWAHHRLSLPPSGAIPARASCRRRCHHLVQMGHAQLLLDRLRDVLADVAAKVPSPVHMVL